MYVGFIKANIFSKDRFDFEREIEEYWTKKFTGAQSFQPRILNFRIRGNFVYDHWECTFNLSPIFLSLKDLQLFISII